MGGGGVGAGDDYIDTHFKEINLHKIHLNEIFTFYIYSNSETSNVIIMKRSNVQINHKKIQR